jgi:hypothetical protein
MKTGLVILLGLLVPANLGAAEPDKRYDIAADLAVFPQAKAQETLTSVLKAIEMKRFDYLVAQLADPAFVDDRVKRLFGGKFEEQVEDTRARLDPGTVKYFQRLLKEGEWTAADDQASVRNKESKDRVVSFRKIGTRWFLEHRSKP